MAKRTIRCMDGSAMTIQSDELSEADLAVAEILLELSVARGSCRLQLDESDGDEIVRRLALKGHRPGDPSDASQGVRLD